MLANQKIKVISGGLHLLNLYNDSKHYFTRNREKKKTVRKGKFIRKIEKLNSCSISLSGKADMTGVMIARTVCRRACDREMERG